MKSDKDEVVLFKREEEVVDEEEEEDEEVEEEEELCICCIESIFLNSFCCFIKARRVASDLFGIRPNVIVKRSSKMCSKMTIKINEEKRRPR